MNKRRWAAWRSPVAAAETLGTWGGMLALITLISGLLGVGEVEQAHAVLSRAVNTAVQSLAQNGCWTGITTVMVRQTLQGGGLPLQNVRVTNPLTTSGAFPTSPTAYKGAVGAQLTVTLHPPGLLGLPVTLTANTQGSSYAPSSTIAICTQPPTPLTASSTTASGGDVPNVANVAVGSTGLVTLTGVDFGATPGYVVFNDSGFSWGSADNAQLDVIAWSPTQIQWQLPPGAPATVPPQYATVTVTNAIGMMSTAWPFSVD